MVFGLDVILAPLRPEDTEKTTCVLQIDDLFTRVLNAIAENCKELDLTAEAEPHLERYVLPLLIQDEIKRSLQTESFYGRAHLDVAAGFIVHYFWLNKTPHTHVDSAALAMETLRVTGLKAIKKWRAWQSFKKADRIDILTNFMNARGDSGSIDVHLPLDVLEPIISEEASCQVLREMTARLRDAFMSDFGMEEEWADYTSMDAMVLIGVLAASYPDDVPLVALNGALMYIMQVRIRITKTKVTKNPVNLEEVSEWLSEFIGDVKLYADWRDADLKAREVKRAILLLKASGRDTCRSLDLLRSDENNCRKCQSHTFLIEQNNRSSDEASEWLRCCPNCGI
jgi:hypothetical protein